MADMKPGAPHVIDGSLIEATPTGDLAPSRREEVLKLSHHSPLDAYVLEQTGNPAWTKHAESFAERALRRLNAAKTKTADDGVECSVGKWQVLSVS